MESSVTGVVAQQLEVLVVLPKGIRFYPQYLYGGSKSSGSLVPEHAKASLVSVGTAKLYDVQTHKCPDTQNHRTNFKKENSINRRTWLKT